MCPQFVDFDADGHTDIVTATFEGTAFLVRGSAKGWGKPEHLVDSRGRNLVLSLYYDTEANEYRNADRSPEGASNPQDHCVSAMVWDWDADGDLDILLGAKEGRLYLQKNEGEAGKPAFTGVNVLLEAGGAPFAVPGGLTAPRLVDWDGDGRLDLVCGSFGGGVFLYRNEGVEGKPRFAAPRALVKGGAIAEGEALFPNEGCYADPVDWDGDGDLDLVVGGYASWTPRARQLSDEEKTRLTELEVEIEEVQAKLSAALAAHERSLEGLDEEARRAAWEKAFAGEEMAGLRKRSNALYKELSSLRPGPKREAGVWLYRRLGPKKTDGARR